MKVTRITNGIKVRCVECKKYHTVRGYYGNNQGWHDDSGWSGTYDVAHGFFESCHAHSLCPIHTAESQVRNEVYQKETKQGV